MALPTLNIIGCGHVGRVLARLWHEHGVFAIGAILNRTEASTAEALAFVGAGTVAVRLGDMPPAAFWMIGVRDDSIEDCARALANNGGLRPGDVVFHCSGSLPSALLAPAKEAGALTASLHPVNSFADPTRDIGNFSSTYGTLEGDDGAVETLSTALSAIGGHPVIIKPDKKLIYHAAAVFACNYLTTLVDTGLQCAEEAGINRAEAQKMLMPLILNTVVNIGKTGPAAALTGPIARGDTELVKKQLAALREWNPETARLYAVLGQRASDLAPSLSAETRNRLKDILQD